MAGITMTGKQPQNTWLALATGLLQNRWARSFLIILIILELYNHIIIPAFLTTQKGIETKSIASNAALRQQAEAELTEWKALNEVEVARYAERKQRADARKASAEAKKNAADAVTAREVANNAQVKARAEAEAQYAEAQIKQQLTLTEAEVARQSARRQKAEADLATEEAIGQRYGAIIIQRNSQQ